MIPQINHLVETKASSESSNSHFHRFQVDRWENIHFYSKPRHVTPKIEHFGKMSPVLRVSRHIYGVSKEIDGKTFILAVHIRI